MCLSNQPNISYLKRIYESDVNMGNILETEDDSLFSRNSNYFELDDINPDVCSTYNFKIMQHNVNFKK